MEQERKDGKLEEIRSRRILWTTVEFAFTGKVTDFKQENNVCFEEISSEVT